MRRGAITWTFVETVRELLRKIPSYWINLDRITARRDLFEERVLPHLGNATRVSAIDGNTVDDDEALVWYTQAHPKRQPVKPTSNPRSQAIRRNHLACMRSHEQLLSHVAESGVTSLILEDDAVVRDQYLDVTLPSLPGPDSVMFLGGGIFAMPSDERAAASSTRHRWAIKPPGTVLTRMYYTHAYVVTPAAASHIATAMRRGPGTVDVSWWPALSDLGAAVSRPQVITQDWDLFSDLRRLYLQNHGGRRFALGDRVFDHTEGYATVVRLHRNPDYVDIAYDDRPHVGLVRATRILDHASPNL